MEEAIERVGLPVKCRTCGKKGRVKPRTDYGGWFRWKLITRTLWYCPTHGMLGMHRKEVLESTYVTPEPDPEPVSVESDLDELYKLLD